MKTNVGYRTVDLLDEESAVKFPMQVFYPTKTIEKMTKFGPFEMSIAQDAILQEGEFPLIIISHGNGGTPFAYRDLVHYLASHGYVVGLPEHPFNNNKDNSKEFTVENLENRPRHLNIAIGWFFKSERFKKHIKNNRVALIGHSIGGYSVLAVAGGKPYTTKMERDCDTVKPIKVMRNERISAVVLLAPAMMWFEAEEALDDVDCPILMYVGEKDEYTGPMCPILRSHAGWKKFAKFGYHAHIVSTGLKQKELLDLRLVKNAGHFSFQSSWPKQMQNPKFLPSQDPIGFDREIFQQQLKVDILNFVSSHIEKDVMPG